MCGRFTLTSSAKVLKDFLPLFDLVDLQPRYNIAPTQPVLALRRLPQSPRPEFVRLRWGLIPHWADDVKIGSRLINARAETVADKPAFRSAIRQRRCLILTDGFYEWQKKLERRKQPYYVRRIDAKPFTFAGLWERWDKEDQAVESCTILTTDANEMMRPIHDRMPVILDPADFDCWLDPLQNRPAELQPLLRPLAGAALTAFAVGTQVNNVRNDDVSCVAPLAS